MCIFVIGILLWRRLLLGSDRDDLSESALRCFQSIFFAGEAWRLMESLRTSSLFHVTIRGEYELTFACSTEDSAGILFDVIRALGE